MPKRTTHLFAFLGLIAACSPPEASRVEALDSDTSPLLADTAAEALRELPSFLSTTPGRFDVALGGFSATLDASGLTAHSGNDALGLALVSWGRADAPQSLTSAEPHWGDCTESTATDCQRFVAVTHPGIEERWEARTRGLEQRWVVDAPPAGSGPLTLSLAIDARAWKVEPSGDGATLTGFRGTTRRYAGLRAWDATSAPTWRATHRD